MEKASAHHTTALEYLKNVKGNPNSLHVNHPVDTETTIGVVSTEVEHKAIWKKKSLIWVSRIATDTIAAENEIQMRLTEVQTALIHAQEQEQTKNAAINALDSTFAKKIK